MEYNCQKHKLVQHDWGKNTIQYNRKQIYFTQWVQHLPRGLPIYNSPWIWRGWILLLQECFEIFFQMRAITVISKQKIRIADRGRARRGRGGAVAPLAPRKKIFEVGILWTTLWYFTQQKKKYSHFNTCKDP